MSPSFNDQLIAVLPRMRRFARGLTGSAADADDLVQAACERALTRTHQFQEGTRFDSWMFRITQTIWIDQLRSRIVRKEANEDEAMHVGTDEPVRGPKPASLWERSARLWRNCRPSSARPCYW